jgi:hypothetical protein
LINFNDFGLSNNRLKKRELSSVMMLSVSKDCILKELPEISFILSIFTFFFLELIELDTLRIIRAYIRLMK